MANFNGHSAYQTDCTFFCWKFVNYGKDFNYDTYYSGGNRLYAPHCNEQEAINMMLRPIATPCDGCPYYEQGTDQGADPPGGYSV